jgi:hypothetical protein
VIEVARISNDVTYCPIAKMSDKLARSIGLIQSISVRKYQDFAFRFWKPDSNQQTFPDVPFAGSIESRSGKRINDFVRAVV